MNLWIRLRTCLIACGVFIAFLLLPVPVRTIGGRILQNRALLNEYTKAFQDYSQPDLYDRSDTIGRFLFFLLVHLALAALVTTLVALRLARIRAKHIG